MPATCVSLSEAGLVVPLTDLLTLSPSKTG